MLELLTASSLLWAVCALTFQVVRAWGGGRRVYGQKAGRRRDGVLFHFTKGMSPLHKESARHHPWLFTVGILLHVGILAAFVQLLLELITPENAFRSTLVTGPLTALALFAGLVLFVRRMRSTTLRTISHLDDYVANLAVGTWLALTALRSADVIGPQILLGYAIAFFLYMPLGKLRHAAFFFVARADFGARLGYRGVYAKASPPLAGGNHVAER